MYNTGISDNAKYMLCKILTLTSITLIVILTIEFIIYAINKYYKYNYNYTWIYKGLKEDNNMEVVSINNENAALVKNSIMLPFIYSKPTNIDDDWSYTFWLNILDIINFF